MTYISSVKASAWLANTSNSYFCSCKWTVLLPLDAQSRIQLRHKGANCCTRTIGWEAIDILAPGLLILNCGFNTSQTVCVEQFSQCWCRVLLEFLVLIDNNLNSSADDEWIPHKHIGMYPLFSYKTACALPSVLFLFSIYWMVVELVLYTTS